jgi:hypothetical protein
MKKSFTLIELLIAVILLLFIFGAMTNLVNSLKRSDRLLKKRIENKQEYLIKTLYYDIVNSDFVKIKRINSNIDEIFMQTTNSLYKMYKPYVKWVVYDDMLIRAESADDFKSEVFTLDNFLKNVKIFKIYKKNGKFLVFVNNKFFEFIKGKYETNNSNSTPKAN